jgi:predicted nuclease with TOPRIM domain
MLIIATVISGLALLAAIICIILLVQEKKRNQKRSAATADYIEAEVTAAFLEADKKIEILKKEYDWALENQKQEFEKEIQKLECNLDLMDTNLTSQIDETNRKLKAMNEDCENRFSNLENGLIPDHEEAKRAVQSLNDFNRGISSIMGFDPYEALKRENQLVQTEEDD